MKIKCIILTAVILTVSSAGFAQSKAPEFSQYRAKVEKRSNIVVNLKSHRDANRFRTNLRNAAKAGINFAGHFVLTSWGCGTNCSVGAIIDARNGKVFFPNELEGAGYGYCELPDDNEQFVYNADSRLLVLSGFKGGDLNLEKAPCGIYYYEWTGTKLRKVGFVKKQRMPTS